VVGLCPPEKEIHIIVDNLSAHTTKKVSEFLESHPEVRLHFHPNLLLLLAEPGSDLVCAHLARVISRGVFTSVKDLARKLMRYIRLIRELLC
jgi:transposase